MATFVICHGLNVCRSLPRYFGGKRNKDSKFINFTAFYLQREFTQFL